METEYVPDWFEGTVNVVPDCPEINPLGPVHE